jgi:hypothetical protein
MGNPGKGLPGFLVLVLASSATGHTVSGHVLGPGGGGLVGVDIDVFDQATGKKLATANDNTGVGGEFDISVPAGVYRIGFDPAGAPGPTLAPKEILDVVVAGDVDLGDISLGYGILVTGTVLGPGGAPVAGVDLDLSDPGTGVKVYTPGDDSAVDGDFEFAAPPGDWLVSVEPLVATRLVAQEIGLLSMPSDTDLGTISLEAGVWLSGRVTSPTGAGILAADVSVVDAVTAEAVPLEDDLTSALGGYLVVVPVGTLDVTFGPPLGSILQPATVAGVVVAGDMVLDVQLHPPATDPAATTIALGDGFLGSFAYGDEVDEVRFEGVAGLLVSLRVKRSLGAGRPDFELIAPSGGPVDLAPYSSGKATGVKCKAVPLPENGVYRLLLYSLDAGTGNYILSTKAKAPPALKKILMAGAIVGPGASVDFPFVALPGSTLKVVVLSGGSGLDPAIVELLDPLGAPVSLAGFLVANPGVSVSIVDLPLAAAGTWTLRVGGNGGTTGAFTGTLKVRFPRPSGLLVAET